MGTESTGCAREKQADFFRRDIHSHIHNLSSHACGKRVRAASGQARWLHRTKGGDRGTTPGFSPRRTARAERLRRGGLLRYPSRVCSIKGDAVERIAEAIDQLASDAQGDVSGQELAARVAELWLMVSALDPELARRKQRYTTPADGTPSA